MKRLPVMIICVGLLAAACGTDTAGSLGPAPTGTGAPSPSVSAPGADARSTTSSAAGSTTGADARSTTAAPPPGGQHQTTPAPPSRGPSGQTALQVWFTSQGKLFVTERTVPATTSVGRAAVEQLLAGPTAAENAAAVRSQIPAGTSLRGLRISSGIATVDLSSSFEDQASTVTMPLRIAQMVYTLAQFPAVTGVRFEIDDQGVTVLGGVPVQSPQTRAMYSGYLPAITVQSPVIGQQVTSPVTVSGTADVFEAVVSVRILDAAGHEIARTFTTASCGTGCRGDYSVTVSYAVPRPEPGTIEVFESSAQDGQPVNVQQVPVTLS
jgi:hypothetical protein